ncbi:MAG: porin family protein [Candidatus Aminicenantes bacterium]|nr:porin family protein [Candidatus Aminicenantes bacterium]
MSQKRKIRLFFLFCLLYLNLLLPLKAGLTFGFLVGQSWQKPDYRQLQFNIDTRWVYGARAGIKVLFLGLEAQYFQVAHHLNLKEIGHSWQNRKVELSYLGVAAKSYFPCLILHPYLSLGYGYYGINFQDLAEKRKASFNFGAGLELFLSEKFSLQAEARYHRPVVSIDQIDFHLGDLNVTVGLNFRIF